MEDATPGPIETYVLVLAERTLDRVCVCALHVEYVIICFKFVAKLGTNPADRNGQSRSWAKFETCTEFYDSDMGTAERTPVFQLAYVFLRGRELIARICNPVDP